MLPAETQAAAHSEAPSVNCGGGGEKDRPNLEGLFAGSSRAPIEIPLSYHAKLTAEQYKVYEVLVLLITQ